ncbi:MAG: hypothetical protein JWO86_1555 [Myxococcaceae bacterium]|nr:hypothetical protein [Myxococcaceae bacterium]
MGFMRSPLASAVAAALLVSSSAACSKENSPDTVKPAVDAAKAGVAIDASASDASGADATDVDASLPDGGLAPTPPSADDWQEVDVSKANVKIRVPSGATVPAEHAGHDAKFAGSFFRVVLPSGYDVLFAERHGNESTDITVEKQAFRAKTKGKGAIVYEAPDAFVITRDEGADAGGKYCEVTACTKVAGHAMCATAAGARHDGTMFKKLTDTECLAVVTIARSIKAR